MNIIYCYDAYCNWCFGFCPVITKIKEDFSRLFQFEVLSGGMILPQNPVHISVTANYTLETYKNVEAVTGVTFGDDYLWHIKNAIDSDWYPDSAKPAIALCILKEYLPDNQVAFATDLQFALQVEGRDLCDDEAYRHLLLQYNFPGKDFYEKLHSKEYREKAYHEFSLVKQLKVTGYPSVLMQITESKLYMIANGYTDYDIVVLRINAVINQINLTKT